MKRSFIGILFLSCHLCATALKFGAVTRPYLVDSTEKEREKAYANFVSHLAKEAKMEIDFVPYSNFGELLEAVQDKKVDLAYYHAGDYAYSVVQGKELYPFGVVLTKVHGMQTDRYDALIVSGSDKNKTLASLKGKTFGFGANYYSSSGFIYTYAFFQKKGIDPSTYFSKVIPYYGHDRALKALNDGEVDAIAVWNEIFFADKKQGKEFYLIEKIAGLPNPPMIATSAVSRKVREQLAKAVVKLPPEAFQKGLSFIGVEPYQSGFYDQCIENVRLVTKAFPKMTEQIAQTLKKEQK